ncbi:MAG: OB-fold domain-containing protein [Euryarchaeota archaeon]|nr:OB-fold domain-containing protein [Euryarchaeota archaeon]MDE1836386.1 OB-fold domain-containing protein [Euryarchaeota archaeon]MDE1881482.1 OB-fold domain-containing protein [Euryarchaeota archaeon]MDE2046483.1 OB-fold domain-containing protein [Thermoplasmata archaeon]
MSAQVQQTRPATHEPKKGPVAPAHSVGEFYKGYEEEGKLLGYECPCGYKTLTYILECPRCGRQGGLKDTTFKGTGTVLAFSLQNVPADEFVNDAPYAYALVQLEEGSVVSGWLPNAKRPEDLKIGDKVHWAKSYKVGMVFEKD